MILVNDLIVQQKRANNIQCFIERRKVFIRSRKFKNVEADPGSDRAQFFKVLFFEESTRVECTL